MTIQNTYPFLTLGLTSGILYLIMQWFEKYYNQKKIDKIKEETESSEILHQGLSQLLSIKSQIQNQRDDEKHLVLRSNAIDIIKKIHPIAKKLGHTDIVSSLEDEFNEQYKYVKILNMIKSIESDSSNHRNYNKGE